MGTVLFLGSGGARFVVARQLRSSGGMWMRFGDTQIHVDPGPGALVRALSHVPPCNPRELAAIALSHKHLDHAGDATAMIEAMTSGGFRRRGTLLAPADALDGSEATVLPYAQNFVERIERTVAHGGPYAIGPVTMRTSIRHVHAVDTFGMHFEHEGLRVSYLPCGKYFEGLADDYAAARPDALIVNVLRLSDGMHADHLTWEDARRVVAHVRPRVAVFQHFGTQMLEADPGALAQALEDELGLRAIAAHDGLMVDLALEVAAVAG